MGPLTLTKSHLACLPLEAPFATGVLHWRAPHLHIPPTVTVSCPGWSGIERWPPRGTPQSGITTSFCKCFCCLYSSAPQSFPPNPSPPGPWKQEAPESFQHHLPERLIETQCIISNVVSFGKDSLSPKQSIVLWIWKADCVWFGDSVYLHGGSGAAYRNYSLTAEWALNIFLVYIYIYI